MAANKLDEVIRHLRKIVLAQSGGGLTDAQLLGEYLSRREDAALTALMRRHSPMVWGVCHRILRNNHDAEDAFQTTFLVLVRRAVSVPKETVGNWLFGVAHRTALNARAAANRRRKRERQMIEMPEPEARQDDLWQKLMPILDQELSRLPNKYRAAIVICDLEGKSRKEAARQLGLPEGTVAGHLARGRTLLAKRLARHGLGVSGAALVATISQNATSACVPPMVVSSTIKAVSLVSSGKVATGVISASVAALTEGVVKSMLLTKLKLIPAMVLLVSLTGVGVVASSPWAMGEKEVAGETTPRPPDFQGVAAELPTDSKKPSETTSTKPVKKSAYLLKIPSRLDGTVQFIGTEIKEKENLLPERVIAIQIGGTVKKFRRLKLGDPVAEGQLLARLNDDPLVEAELARMQRELQMMRKNITFAQAIAEEATVKYNVASLLLRRKAVAAEDIQSAKFTADMLYWNAVGQQKTFEVADAEVRRIQILSEFQNIRNTSNGVIAAIYKHPGETVKKFETVIEIEVAEKDKNPSITNSLTNPKRVVKITSPLTGFLQVVGEQITVQETLPQHEIVLVLIGSETKRFRRLKQGDSVQKGQLMARLDDRLARADLAIKESKLTSNKAIYESLEFISIELDSKFKLATNAEERRSVDAKKDKLLSELRAQERVVKIAQTEVQSARKLIENHDIHSTVSGEIRSIYRFPGEAVKETETIFEIEVAEKNK